MIESRFYSYALVGVQFTCIAILIFANSAMFSEPISFVLIFISLGILASIIAKNSSTNFNIIPEIKEGASLAQTGIYAYVRHPMYLAVGILSFAPLAHAFVWTNILTATILYAALFLKIKKEEYLWLQKSPEYLKYKQNTKMLIPFIL